MPENRLSPLEACARELDREAAGIAAPSSPAEVRRVADGRRRRRLVIALVAVLVVALTVGTVLVRTLSGSQASPQWAAPTAPAHAETRMPSTAAPTTSSAVSTSRAVTTPSSVVTPSPKLSLGSVADIEAQTWMPSGAKALFETQFRASSYARCSGHVLVIDHYRLPDLIGGQEWGQGCGGTAYLWGLVDGQWKVLADGQQPPRCTAIQDSGWNAPIPGSMFGGICIAPNGSEMPYSPTTATAAATRTASLQQPLTAPS